MDTTSREYDVLIGKQTAYYRCEAIVWQAIAALNSVEHHEMTHSKARHILDDILIQIKEQNSHE